MPHDVARQTCKLEHLLANLHVVVASRAFEYVSILCHLLRLAATYIVVRTKNCFTAQIG